MDFDIKPGGPEMAISGWDHEHEVGACDSTINWIVGVVDEFGEAVYRSVWFEGELDGKGWPHRRNVHRVSSSVSQIIQAVH